MKPYSFLSILILAFLSACTSKSGQEQSKTNDSTALKTGPSPVTLITWKEVGVRETSGEKGKYLTTAYLGEEVKLSGDTASELSGNNRYHYHKVVLSDGKSGWIRDEFIAIDVFAGAVLDDVEINKRPDDAALTDQHFNKGDFVVSKSNNPSGWTEVTGKRASDKWFTSGYIHGQKISFDPVDVRFAVLSRRAREEAKPELKSVLEKQLTDEAIFGKSAFWIANQKASTGNIGALSDALIGYYPLNGDGSDASGNGNDGEVNGTVTATADRKNNASGACLFDGQSYIVLKLINPERLEIPFSVSAWFLSNNKSREGQTMVSMGRSENGTGFAVSYGNGNVAFGFIGADAPVVAWSPITSKDVSKWHQLTGTHDGENITLYLDGELLAKVAVSDQDLEAMKAQFASTSQPIEIGRELPTLDRYFDGSIDNVMIFNRALSSDEVRALFTKAI